MVNKKMRYEPSVREATGNVDVSSQSVDVSSRSKGMENRMEMGEVFNGHTQPAGTNQKPSVFMRATPARGSSRLTLQ